MQETIKDVVKLSELLEDAAITYSSANPSEKEKIIRVIFSELTLTENTLQYKCKKRFVALQSRFAPNYDPMGNRSHIIFC